MSRNTIYENIPLFYGHGQVHAILVSYLKKQMPTFGKDGEQRNQHLPTPYCPGKKKELLRGLEKVFEYLSIEFRIPLTDFPDVNETRKKLAKYFDHFLP